MERLFSAFRMVLAPVRGSLYIVVILTSTVFAMATGIVGAAVTVLGIMAGPIMIKTGYNPVLSAGAITAGGTLGILIPPSVMLIVMGPVLGYRSRICTRRRSAPAFCSRVSILPTWSFEAPSTPSSGRRFPRRSASPTSSSS